MNISGQSGPFQISSTIPSNNRGQPSSSQPPISHSTDRASAPATLLWKSDSTPHWGVMFRDRMNGERFIAVTSASGNIAEHHATTESIHGRVVTVNAEWPSHQPSNMTARIDLGPDTLHLDFSSYTQRYGESFADFIRQYTPLRPPRMDRLPIDMGLAIAQLLPFESMKVLRATNKSMAGLVVGNIHHLSIKNWRDLKKLLSTKPKPLPTALGSDIRKISLRETESIMSKNWITDTRIKKFSEKINATLPPFAQLELHRCKKITTEALKHLQMLQGLQRLTLSYCDLPDSVLEHFKPLSTGTQPFPNLTHLNLTGCRKIATTANLRHLSTLQYVCLDDCPEITDLEPFRHMPGLKTLSLRACEKIGHSVLQHLEHLTGLESLSLASCKLSDVYLQKLQNLSPQLKHLDLAFTPLSDNVMRMITSLNLESLDLYGCKFSFAGLNLLENAANTLKNLDLTYYIDPANLTHPVDLQFLQRLTGLTSLSLGDVHLRNTDLQTLQWLPNLQRLTLRGSEILDANALRDHILPLQNLTYLNISGCRGLTGASVQHLLKFPVLDTLDVHSCNFNADELSRLRENIRNVKS